MVISEVVKTGTVKAVNGETVTVGVDCATSECKGCKISMFCRNNDAVELVARNPRKLALKPGERVMLAGKLSNWLVGWLLLAGVPCVAILAGICIGYVLGWSDAAMGGLCLALLAGYYLLLWKFRRGINRRVVWEIQSLEAAND